MCGRSSSCWALSGASLGKKMIPPEWRKSLRLYPYDREWVENVIARVKDWPHGVEDIQAAHRRTILSSRVKLFVTLGLVVSN